MDGMGWRHVAGSGKPRSPVRILTADKGRIYTLKITTNDQTWAVSYFTRDFGRVFVH